MAIASYFGKNLLAMNQLLHSDGEELIKTISDQVIGLAFDENAVSTAEGCATLDLMTRLIARFYPRVGFIGLKGKHQGKKEELIALARSINSRIDIVPDGDPIDSLLIAGEMNDSDLPTIGIDGIRIFLGSSGWDAKFSLRHPMRFSDTTNPFGCGAAACIAVSMLFRHVFRASLGNLPDLPDTNVSILHLQLDGPTNPPIGDVILDDVVLAGLGAIGNGCIWALSKIPSLAGNLQLVDMENLAESNLQRYALAEEKDTGVPKVTIATALFHQTNLHIIPHQKSWAEYVSARDNWHINCAAVGVDTKKDRIGIQSSLPRIIFNAFTEPEVIGISRHLDFLNEACLGCGYIPTEKVKNYINEVADNLHISGAAEMIKDYLNRNQPADAPFLALIAQANNIDVQAIQHFAGVHIEQFYSEFVCGGILLSLSGDASGLREIDAPIAFQSAFAGILLAAEIVKYFSGNSINVGQRTDLYFLQSIGGANPLNRPLQKDKTGRCICRDEDFRSVYQNKWNLKDGSPL
jgi:hypothetical protein